MRSTLNARNATFSQRFFLGNPQEHYTIVASASQYVEINAHWNDWIPPLKGTMT